MYKAVYCRKKSFLIDVRFCEILLTSQIKWNLANKTTLILRKRWSIDKSGLGRVWINKYHQYHFEGCLCKIINHCWAEILVDFCQSAEPCI